MTSTNRANQTGELMARGAGVWTLDPETTTINFQTRAMWGLAKVKGTFKAVKGAAQITETGNVEGVLVIDATSVDTGNKKRDAHLRSADFFDSDKHPSFVFSVHSAQTSGDATITLHGTFSVREHSRPLDITAIVGVLAGRDTVQLRTEFNIDRSDWGVAWTKMGARTLTELVISARFTKTSDATS